MFTPDKNIVLIKIIASVKNFNVFLKYHNMSKLYVLCFSIVVAIFTFLPLYNVFDP